jgi:glycosyltransferase
LISIITINYNNSSGLEKTLSSFAVQNNSAVFEHVIIDGGSTDSSLSIVHNYMKDKDNVIFQTKRDRGIYDAMNKGLKLATGEFVAFLNSGDTFASRDCLRLITDKLMEEPETDFLYGDISMVGDNGRRQRHWISGSFSKPKLYFGWIPPHPLTTIRTTILNSCGNFNLKYKIAADYDLMLRVLILRKLKITYLPKTIVNMEAGGISNGSLSGIMKGNWEVIQSWFHLKGVIFPYWIFLTFLTKALRKILQLRR